MLATHPKESAGVRSTSRCGRESSSRRIAFEYHEAAERQKWCEWFEQSLEGECWSE